MKKIANVLAEIGIPSLPSDSPDTIAALIWAREIVQKHMHATYSVKDPEGVEELKPVKIGGVDQWLHIRGRKRNNPILLFLHGGPGFPMTGLMDAVQRPWEDYFTVVQWDQRQTGKSYYPADDVNSPLTVSQMIEDTKEVIQYLLAYLNHNKLFVLGQSWGSVLGMHMAKRHPNWLHAYIGIGQVVNVMDNERLLFQRLIRHARVQKKDELLSKLETIAPYPNPDNSEESFAKNSKFVRSELSRLAGETLMHHTFFDDALKMWAFERAISPHLTMTDITNAFSGDEIALYRPNNSLRTNFMSIDLPRDVGSSFQVPVFFFTGAHDWHTPRVLSDKWFDQINAPYKELIHFEESSHMVVNEEPGKFLATLVAKVLPMKEAEHSRGVNRG